jgi:catechol 2,3-dioxygenase-like lactoylglutathione lyase family enzyme
MRLLVIAALSLLSLAGPAFAQLAPHNEAGVTFGHVHLTVTDPEAARKIWVDQFGGTIAQKGTFVVVKMPNMMIAFRKAEPTGTTEGTALDHFGLKVPDLQAALKKWRDAGYTVDREFVGSEKMPNAFISGPDKLRIELQEDKTLKVPAAAYHLHYRLPDAVKLRDWYVETYGLKAARQGNFEVAEAPGMRLLFQNTTEAPKGGTRGTATDHIGFEIKNLKAFLANLEAKGIKLETAYREIPNIGLNISYLYDPQQVYIEMTEGYDQY